MLDRKNPPDVVLAPLAAFKDFSLDRDCGLRIVDFCCVPVRHTASYISLLGTVLPYIEHLRLVQRSLDTHPNVCLL